MKKKGDNKNMPQGDEKENNIQGYPSYTEGEDIYAKYRKEKDIDPEDINKTSKSNETGKVGAANEKDFNDDESGSDLDIPGSELDDEQEIVGSEDEENNYYSLGGDDHNDLDEDKDE